MLLRLYYRNTVLEVLLIVTYGTWDAAYRNLEHGTRLMAHERLTVGRTCLETCLETCQLSWRANMPCVSKR